MACRTSSFHITMPVFSDGTTTNTDQFIPFKRVMVEEWVRARISLVMNGNSGAMKVSTAVMYGDVDAEFVSGSNTPVDMPSTPLTLTADGQEFGTEFTAISTSYQMVEFGVRAYNDSGTDREMAQVTLNIELQE